MNKIILVAKCLRQRDSFMAEEIRTIDVEHLTFGQKDVTGSR